MPQRPSAIRAASVSPTTIRPAPSVGERLPDFTLPDAFGRTIDYHADRGSAKSVVVFFRSAVW